MAELPTVVVRFGLDGEIEYFVSGEGIRLLIIDERAADDRIYEWLPRASPETMATLIPADADIGSNQDARHSAAAHLITTAMRGERHLSIVPAGAGLDGETA